MEEREGIAVFRCLFDIFWGAAAAIDLHVSEKLILPRENMKIKLFGSISLFRSISVLCDIRVQEH